MSKVKGEDRPRWRTTGIEASPSLFGYCTADMSQPTTPVKRVCFADDITIWASGDSRASTKNQGLPQRDVAFLKGQLADDFGT